MADIQIVHIYNQILYISATSKSKICYSKNYLTGNTYMAMVVLIKALYIPKHVSLLPRLPVGRGGVIN